MFSIIYSTSFGIPFTASSVSFVINPVMSLQTSPVLVQLATYLTLKRPCVHMLGLNMPLNNLFLVRTDVANSTTKCFEAHVILSLSHHFTNVGV